MANTYYDSQLTAAEIEAVLEAINGILTQANNGKVLAISNGKFEARSVQWGGGSAVVQPLNVTQNGTYNPPSGVDGYAPVTVNVSGGDTPPTGTLIYYKGTQYEVLQTVVQSSASVSISFDDEYIKVHQISSANNGFAVHTQGQIDLSSYQKVKVEYFATYTGSSRYNPRFGCLENLPVSNPFDFYPNFITSDVLGNYDYPIETLELDISNLSGNYYIGLSGFNTDAYITGIWLE